MVIRFSGHKCTLFHGDLQEAERTRSIPTSRTNEARFVLEPLKNSNLRYKKGCFCT